MLVFPALDKKTMGSSLIDDEGVADALPDLTLHSTHKATTVRAKKHALFCSHQLRKCETPIPRQIDIVPHRAISPSVRLF